MLLLSLLILLVVTFSYLVGEAAYGFFPGALTKVKYKWPIGFFMIIGIIQLVSFPIQYTHVSMQSVSIIYSLVLAALVGFIVIGLRMAQKDQRQQLFKLQSQRFVDYGLIIGFIVFNFIICFATNSLNDTNADQSFYISLVQSNIGVTQINEINPLLGVSGRLNGYYNFQSFYLFLTYLSSIFKVEAVLVMGWLVPSLLWLTAATTFLNLIAYFKGNKKAWMTIALFLILWVSLGQFDYFVRYNVYGNNLRLFVFCYLMMMYAQYVKQSNIKTLMLCAILWLSAVSFQSTSLFLGVMLMVGIGLYELFYRRKDEILPLIFSATPLLAYMGFFLSYQSSPLIGIVVAVFVSVLVLLTLNQTTKKMLNTVFYSKVFRILIIMAIVGMTVVSILMTPHLNYDASLSPQQFFAYLFEKYAPRRTYLVEGNNSAFVLALVRDLILLLNILAFTQFRKLKGRVKFALVIELMLVLVFYNPLVCGFVSTAFTGNVFMRTSDIVMSLFVVAALLSACCEQSKLKPVITVLGVLAIVQLGMNTSSYLSYHFHQIAEPKNFNHLYRMEDDLVEAGQALADYTDQEADAELARVFMTRFEMSYFNHRYEMVYTVDDERRAYDDIYRQTKHDEFILRDAIRKSYELTEQQQLAFKQALLSTKLDLFVVHTEAAPWLYDTLASVGHIIYENPSYVIYEIK